MMEETIRNECDDAILGAVDVGSNAVRLVVDRYRCAACERLERLVFDRRPLSLGDDVFAHGTVGPRKIEALCAIARQFVERMNACGAVACRACATSALREAKNASEVVEAVARSSGLILSVVSGDEEADLMFAALRHALPASLQTQPLLYMDVGGGSTELLVYDCGRRVAAHSFPVGALRSGERVAGELLRVARFAAEQADRYAPRAVVATGGNIRKIHELLGKGAGEPIAVDELEALERRLQPLDTAARMEALGISERRARILPPALSIFLHAARAARVDRFEVPGATLADGILLHLCASRRRG